MSGVVIAGILGQSDLPVRLLAVVGGFALGGFLAGLFMQLLVKALTARKLPRWALWAVRLLGGLLVGWLVALWLFGAGGGWGFGGPGGPGTGTGSGTGKDPTNGPPPKAGDDKDATKKPPDSPPPQETGATLRVEVLGPAALERIAGADPERPYRIETKDGPKLMTLEEVRQFVRERQAQPGEPLRRLEIVLYLDSPARGVRSVARLEEFARDLPVDAKEKVQVDFSSPGENAPPR